MSSKDIARRTSVSVVFAGTDISAEIKPYLKSLTYTDNEADETDDLQIKLQDVSAVWLTSWLGKAVGAATGEPGAHRNVSEGLGTCNMKVTARSGLNVRSSPGGAKIGCLTYGIVVAVTGTSGDWSKIEYSGQEAYVYSTYLAATDEAPSSGASGGTVKGLKVQAVIGRQNWWGDGNDALLDCGEFELDSVNESGPPCEVTIKATSLPYNATVRQTKKDKAWEAYTLSGIANEIAAANGMACQFLCAENPRYERVEQTQLSDIAFLEKLCSDANISLKATNNVLVLFDDSSLNKSAPDMTISRGDKKYIKYKLSTGKAETEYAKCHVAYTAPDGRVIEATYSDPDSDGDQVLEIRQKVSSVGEALALAQAQLMRRNKFEKSATFTFPGSPYLVAGTVVYLNGFGMWDGTYVVKQAKHSVSASSGYVTTLELRMAT